MAREVADEAIKILAEHYVKLVRHEKILTDREKKLNRMAFSSWFDREILRQRYAAGEP